MSQTNWSLTVGVIDMLGNFYQESTLGKRRRRVENRRRLIDRIRDPFGTRTYLGMNTY